MSENLADIIKYEGGNETFIWKHPCEDFNTGTQLIVHESQEAVFFMNGQALDLFPAGRYALESQNLPLVGKFFNKATGGMTPFHCEVYFINRAELFPLKWGTDSKLGYIEPVYGFPVQIGASGEMAMRVADSRKLLIKVVGTERGITQESFSNKIRGFLMTRIKAHMTAYIKRKKINIFEMDENLITISEALHEYFKPEFEEYGVSLERFVVKQIVLPEDDDNFKAARDTAAVQVRLAQQQAVESVKDVQISREAKRAADAERYKKERSADAEGYRLRQMGITRQEELQLDAIKTLAGNEAVGQMTNTGIGLGMMTGVGFGVGGAVGGMVSETMGNALKPQNHQNALNSAACTKCGRPLPADAKFCLECGQQVISVNEIICPSCGKKTPKGKFCLECGAPMVNKCPECGTEIPLNGKFCLECGHKL